MGGLDHIYKALQDLDEIERQLVLEGREPSDYHVRLKDEIVDLYDGPKINSQKS